MFEKLPSYLEWANTKTFDSMTALSEMPEDGVKKFGHILAAEEIWLSRLQGRAAEVQVWPEEVSGSFHDWIRRNGHGYREYLSLLSDSDLRREVIYSNSQGAKFSSLVSDVLIHVISHGNYHRGQIAVLVKDRGGTPATTDYIFFARSGG